MNQEIKKSFNLTKEKIKEFKKLNNEEKEKNLFFLKTALNDIISFVKYSLIQIGEVMDIEWFQIRSGQCHKLEFLYLLLS